MSIETRAAESGSHDTRGRILWASVQRLVANIAAWLANAGQAISVEVVLLVQRWRRWRAQCRGGALASDCGSLAVSNKLTFSGTELNQLCLEGQRLLGQIKAGQAESVRLGEIIKKLDRKLEAPKVRENRSQIKSLRRQVAADSKHLAAVQAKLGVMVLASPPSMDDKFPELRGRMTDVKQSVEHAELELTNLVARRTTLKKLLHADIRWIVIGAACVLVVVLSVALAGGTSKDEGQAAMAAAATPSAETQEQRYAKAIQAFLETEAQFHLQSEKDASQAGSNNAGVKSAVMTFARNVESLDSSACPADFREALAHYAAAWRGVATMVFQAPDTYVAGIVEGLGNMVLRRERDGGHTRMLAEVKQREAQLQETYAACGVIAARYGVSIPKDKPLLSLMK